MGTHFFLIMQGSVSILTPAFPTSERRKNSFDNLKLFDKAFSLSELQKKQAFSNNEKNNQSQIPNIEVPQKNDNSMMQIKVLFSGETFGEYSLINNQPAQARIKCKEDCHFAILEKKDFNAILSKTSIKKFLYIELL